MNTLSPGPELLDFAGKFVERHLGRFQKDISICLTSKVVNGDQETHAYFPALMACFGALDLFSGLHAGNLKDNGFENLKCYVTNFLPPLYDKILLAILYYCFRHKVAHLAHPYDVFDTDTALSRSGKTKYISDKRRWVTWNVDENDTAPAISLEKLSTPEKLTTAPNGWNVMYDHRAHVHLGCLSKDIVGSVRGNSGYLTKLKTDPDQQTKFAACMNEYFPTYQP